MAEIRQGYLDDYSQNSTGVGIGTSSPVDAKFEIVGGTTSQELNVTGIATFGSVSGFIEKHTTYTENVNITNGNSGTLSGEIVVGSGLTMTVGTAATTSQGSVDSLKVLNMFQPPSGTTNQRPPAKTGALFYNFDFKTIEFFDGSNWNQVDNTTRRGRAVWAGGYDNAGVPSHSTSSIDFINVPTLGNSINFGDLTAAGQDAHGCGSETRGVYMGKFNSNAIEYITIASEGDSIDFGDITSSRNYGASGSSSTRGMHFGGDTPSNSNIIDYIQINTLGDALDFGDLTVERLCYGGSLSNGRTISVGGGTPAPNMQSTYDQVTIAAKGNAVEFGELISRYNYGPSGNSNTVRGVLFGGQDTNQYAKQIQYITLSSGGNAQYFGDLSRNSLGSGAGVTAIRAVFAIGRSYSDPSPGNDYNILEFVTIATTGNTQDFGDLRGGLNRAHSRVISPVSDSHGGLGGF